MKFLYKKYQAKKKEIIEVELDQPTKVKFMTASEFKKYTGARTHTYFGGRFEESPIRFVLPFDSVWHVVIEKGPSNDMLDIKATTRLLNADRTMLSSVAADAPAHVRSHIELDEADAEAISLGGRSEG